MTFQVGDIVRLKNGNAPQQVRHVNHPARAISTVYLSTLHYDDNPTCAYYDRREQDYVLLEAKPQSNPKEDHTMNQNTLFQTKEEKPRYGHYIATNPEGRIVLMMDDGYQDFEEKDIVEVLPHTVEIVFSNGQTHHFALPAGKVEIDDIVVWGINLGRVKKVGTKNRNPKSEPKDLRKVATLKID